MLAIFYPEIYDFGCDDDSSVDEDKAVPDVSEEVIDFEEDTVSKYYSLSQQLYLLPCGA